jgi:hypothetical protein
MAAMTNDAIQPKLIAALRAQVWLWWCTPADAARPDRW